MKASVWKGTAVAVWVALLALFTVLPLHAQEKALRGVALVIGQARYVALPALANPGNDAKAIGRLLADLGFEVDTVLDADGARLARALDRFAEDAQGADVALLYYSGHGVEAGGKNYLVPVDADPASPNGLLPTNTMLERMRRAVPLSIILLDACRDNPFPPGTTLTDEAGAPQTMAAVGLGATRGVSAFASETSGPESVGAVIGFAAEPGKVALDGEAGGNSPYATALLKHLPAGGFPFADVMTLVTEEVYLRSDGRQVPWTNTSLRRQLYFGGTPEPAAADATRIRTERRGLLLTIATLSPLDREQVASVAREEGVPMDVLFAALKAAGAQVPTTPDDFGRMLRAQGALAKERLAGIAAAISDPELKRLAGLAEEAVREGALDAATDFHRQARERMDSLSSTLTALEAGTAALRKERAAVYADSAATWLLKFDHAQAAEDYGRAFAEVEKSDEDLAIRYKTAQARALADGGYFRADNAMLEAAIEAYRDAADLAPLRSHPDQWLLAQAGLGNALATLGDREADDSRLAEAVDLLGKAAKDMPASADPETAVSVRSELAYALFLSGMREPGVDKLDQAAIGLAETLMTVPLETRPAEWGRLMHRMAAAQYEMGRRLGDVNALEAALSAAEAALQVRTREAVPLDWMTTENNRAIILSELGALMGGTDRIDQAIAAYRGVLEVGTRDRGPLLWAETMANLGTAQAMLAERSGKRADLDAALASYRSATQEMTRERAPLRWAALQDNIGMALRRQGERDKDADLLAQAVAAFASSLEERRRDIVPADWAATSAHLANAYWALAKTAARPDDLDRAIDTARRALEGTSKEARPIDWAMLHNNLGGMLFDLGVMRDEPARFEAAAEEYRQALTVFNPDETGLLWGQATGSLGETLLEGGKRSKDRQTLEKAKATLDETVEIWRLFGDEKRRQAAQLLAGEAQLALLSLELEQKIKDAEAKPAP